MTVRMSTTTPWPNPSEVFGLEFMGTPVPLLLIAIMTFVLITSSGTMAMAVKFGYEKRKVPTFWLLMTTAVLGATFVGMQAFEWTKLIVDEGVRPWSNPMGAPQFGAAFFMITGFHGTHVSFGVLFLFITAFKVRRGDLDKETPGFMTGRKNRYEIVETMGLYWHFVDLVWVFIFAFFYLLVVHTTSREFNRCQTKANNIQFPSTSGFGACCSCSAPPPYMVDYVAFQGYVRWTLIIIFMMLKAGLIVAIFMHMMWERMALIYAILVPTLVLIVLVGLMAGEADYTWLTREEFFTPFSWGD